MPIFTEDIKRVKVLMHSCMLNRIYLVNNNPWFCRATELDLRGYRSLLLLLLIVR